LILHEGFPEKWLVSALGTLGEHLCNYHNKSYFNTERISLP
jgi:hypothetical protein